MFCLKEKNFFSSERTIKYFLVQRISAILLLISFIMKMIMSLDIYNMFMFILRLLMLLKIGAAPFHSWFPIISNMSSWSNNIILITWQKFAPLYILMFNFSFSLVVISTVLSAIIGSLGQVRIFSIRLIIAFSSISNISWIIIVLIYNYFLMLIFLFVYSVMTIFIIYYMKIKLMKNFNQQNLDKYMVYILMVLLTSIAGMPPFLGFFRKWLIIYILLYFKMIIISIILFNSSILNFFIYLRLFFSSLVVGSKKYFNNNAENKYFSKILLMLVNIFIPLLLLIL